MDSYLRIHVTFLGGYYHGEEWPPAPMRLLQALVAGSAWAGLLDTSVAAFSWFEKLNPPTIHAPRLKAGNDFTTYVPRNSDDITLREHYKDIAAYEVRARRRVRYDAQPTLRRWISSPIAYEWPIADEACARKLGHLSHELVCLGRGEDLAFARFQIVDQPLQHDANTWMPSSSSSFMRNPLRVPMAGSFSSMTTREQARRRRVESKSFVDPPILYDECSYDCGAYSSQRPYLLYDLHDLDQDGWLNWRHNDGVTVAAMIRHALSTRVPQACRGYATGHAQNGSLDDRLSWIPLPSIGHQHADGRIRRAMILGPEGEHYDAKRFLEIRHALAHAPLFRHGKQVGTIDETDDVAGAIRPYLQEGIHWKTVIPLVTHGRTTRGRKQKGKFDPRKAKKLILAAFANAGLPLIVSMHYQPAPFERSGRVARDYRVPRHLAGFSRFHVSVTFAEPVSGPVLVGVGRHYGFGLFKPLD
jgi:CRISPR-associated protein Csb2